MKIAIIDYESGNLHSIEKATRLCAPDGAQILVTNDSKDIKSSTHIILPGVGAFGDCINNLKKQDGIIDELNEQVLVKKKPFFGICVGMQMLAQKGLEHGEHEGLGWIKGVVEPIEAKKDLKIPHMGWNDLVIEKEHPILKKIKTGDNFYFVHSYYFNCQEKNTILSKVCYGNSLTAIIAKDNIVATQFHPEKSQEAGLRIISNFLSI